LQINQPISDQELFRKFVQENKPESLFREIMTRFKQKVYWQVRRILVLHDDADEVCQIVFIKLWQNAETFKFNSALSSFIFRIAYNESITFLKQKNRFRSFDDLLDSDGHYSKQIQQGNEMDGNEIEAKLQQALLTLPEKQRLVFNYRYFDEMPYKEISDITGTSEGALKASYHHAAEKIKLFLEID
jgi:RNA polymerase sigma factor (sigma-70 family)